MRIEIRASAQQHGITDAEIRATITYPALRLPLTARLSLDDLDRPREELLGKVRRQEQRRSAGA